MFTHEQCQKLQKEEWEVLESIYPDCVSSDLSCGSSVRLEIPVELPEPRRISIYNDNGTTRSLTVSALPTLLLSVELPPSYPLEAPPRINLIRATHVWFPHVQRLREELKSMWLPGEGVLYSWIEFIHEGQFLEPECTSDTITIPHPAPDILVDLLSTHESASCNLRFAQHSYPCSICLAHLKGSKCLQLTCGHIFCRSCLRNFWQMCVTEGDITRVRCPDPACTKDGTDASEEEVARVLTSEEIERWRWLKEKHAMEQDPSIVHCPVTFCQKPVSKPSFGDPDSGWNRLRTCPSCSYSFCSFCKHGWHGPISPCLAVATNEVVERYLATKEGSAERNLILLHYGRKTILKLVAAYENEQLNEKWLKSSTTSCPGCNVHVEKTAGCNHMTCSKCQQHFCYRCGQRLKDNPYAHFSTPGLPCFNQLFDVQNTADDDEWIVELL